MIPVSRLFSVQDQSNTLSSYTLKGIEFLEKVGSFVKEKAILDEEYASRLRNLTKKYSKKADEEEIWKEVTFVKSFNGFLYQLELIAIQFHETSELLRQDVVSYVSEKSLQHRSARKSTINDLATIDEDLSVVINELCKAKKNYVRTFKEAESSYQKYTKADKNMEISRLELEKAKTQSNVKIGICEEAKSEYSKALSTANDGQNSYFEKLLPMIFDRFKALDKERVADTKEVLQRFLNIDKNININIVECRNGIQQCVNHIQPETDAQLVLECVEATVERSAPFHFDDLGDPKDAENRPADYVDSKISYPMCKKKEISPGKRKSIRQLFRKKEKSEGKANSEDEDYADLPPKVRLRCLNSKIGKLEKRLEKSRQGREGLNKLQNAYRENPKLGNASECNEPLIQHAKEIEKLTTRIDNMKILYEDVEVAVFEAGDFTERSFGGRDTTPDTTRSISGCSTNISSKTSTLESAGLYSEGTTEPRFSISGDDFVKVRSTNSFSTTPKSTTNSPALCRSTPTSHRSLTSPLRRKQVSPMFKSSAVSESSRKKMTPSCRTRVSKESEEKNVLGSAVVLFSFEGTAYGTISVKEGDQLELIEKDDGDGWIKVRKSQENEEGFVPTSYLKCDFV